MARKIELKMSLSGIHSLELLRQVAPFPPFGLKPPTKIIVDSFDEYPGTSDWIDQWTSNCRYSVMAEWGNWSQDEYYEGFITYEAKEGGVKFQISDFELTDVQSVMRTIAHLPWTLAVFPQIYPKWRDESGNKYYPPGFRGFHFLHGWACAFKGEGHNRLVSRRWLEFGPWRLLRDETNDISLVQFHDINADPATALEQAKPGHERMGFSDKGGFIRRDYILELQESESEDATVVVSPDGKDVTRGQLFAKLNYKHFPQGLYNSGERKLEIVFVDRELPERELLECCIMRYFQDLGEDQPIDKVAYVFIVPEEAQQHLHQLWLRELECWTFPEGLKVRFDTDYHPVPHPPEWVRRLEESENT